MARGILLRILLGEYLLSFRHSVTLNFNQTTLETTNKPRETEIPQISTHDLSIIHPEKQSKR